MGSPHDSRTQDHSSGDSGIGAHPARADESAPASSGGTVGPGRGSTSVLIRTDASRALRDVVSGSPRRPPRAAGAVSRWLAHGKRGQAPGLPTNGGPLCRPGGPGASPHFPPPALMRRQGALVLRSAGRTPPSSIAEGGAERPIGPGCRDVGAAIARGGGAMEGDAPDASRHPAGETSRRPTEKALIMHRLFRYGPSRVGGRWGPYAIVETDRGSIDHGSEITTVGARLQGMAQERVQADTIPHVPPR